MKLVKPITRLIITAGSIAGFVGGWALLAHAHNPVNTSAAPAAGQTQEQFGMPTLAPIPSLQDEFGDLQPLPNLPQTRGSFQPRFRSGGS